ncbi:MAG: DEAD/DEAH box helicase [Candidatus Njordarchaeales archaeon]
MRIRREGLELVIEFRDNEKAFKEKGLIFDKKTGTWRFLPMHYFSIKNRALLLGYEIVSDIRENFSLSDSIAQKISRKYELRDYQKQAVDYLAKNNWMGVIVLPTGAGKTLIGIEVLRRLSVRTLIVVPTLDLMNQWLSKLVDMLSIPKTMIGLYGGGKYQIKEVTIVTYASAHKKEFLERALDYFGLVIFDEAHHLAGELNKEIAKRLVAPYRIGLTATPGEKVKMLEALIGPIIRIASFRDLAAKGYLAEFDFERIYVKLTEEEAKRYKELMRIYLDYISKIGVEDEIERFRELVKRSAKDKDARKALLARIEAKDIALKAERKLAVLEELLRKHKDEKVIIFTRHVDAAKYISTIFGIPYVTGDMDKKKRKEILDMFKRGEVTKLVTAEVLDEGIDLPSASVGIILAGRPSKRQLIQRVGRVLRPAEGKVAKIYEVVTRATYDYFASRKRRIKFTEL